MNDIRRFGREPDDQTGLNGRNGLNGHSHPIANGIGNGHPRATNVAVVGLGYWGPNLLRVLFELPDVKVKYACDLDTSRLAKAIRRYPSVEPTTEFARVLDDPEVDAVFIATPVFTHFALASHALEAGKHVFVEKPLAASSAEAEELLDLSDANELSLMCGHTFIYSPPVRAVKRMIDAGELGDIYFISSSRVNLGLHQRDVSVIWDLGPHDFSILQYWLGDLPESVSAIGRDSVVKGIPDVAFVDLAYGSGTLAHVEMSWLAPSKLRRTVLVGSEKMVVYDDTSSEPVRVFDSGVDYHDPESFGEYQLSYRTGDILSPKLDTTEPLAAELSDFVRSIRDGDPVSENRRVARDVVRLIEAAEASLEERGAPIAVPSSVSVGSAS
ncbi:MAG: Gfo/Idh/MocA family protein [Thermoleophilaceae bacterium]